MKKVLLMGPSRSGKTSMRSVIFANFLPHDTGRLLLSTEIERSQVKFLGNLVLNLWDCGGQYDFIEKYLDNQKDVIFSHVAVLVYVFDVAALTQEKETEDQKWTKKRSYEYFANCLSRLLTYSQDATIYCFLHKVDLFPIEERAAACQAAQEDILSFVDAESRPSIHFFGTSIWEPSLYDAWNTVVQCLIPHREIIAHNVNQIRLSCKAPYAAVLDRSTLLCICDSYEGKPTGVGVGSPSTGTSNGDRGDPATGPPIDITSFGNRLKRLKVAMASVAHVSHWSSIEIKTPGCVGVLAGFTTNTFIVVLRPVHMVGGSGEQQQQENDAISVTLLRKSVENCSKAFRTFMERSPDLALTQEIL